MSQEIAELLDGNPWHAFVCVQCGMRAKTDDLSVVGRNCPRDDFETPHDMRPVADNDPEERGAYLRDDETLGPCGCTDYHMSDCPTRTGGSGMTSDDYLRAWERGGYRDDYYDQP